MEHPLPEVFTPQGVPHAELACDNDAPLLAEVVKTTSDPYVGRVSLVRVFSGTIRPDTTVHVSGHFSSFFGGGTSNTHPDHDEDERIESCRSRWASNSARQQPWSRATSAPSAS